MTKRISLNKVSIEKCIACNGSGQQQIFDDVLNEWVYPLNPISCKNCNGTKIRKYILSIDGSNFLKTKTYI